METDINNNDLIHEMIEYYDRWGTSEFKLNTNTYYKTILGSGVSVWLKTVILYKTEYSELEETTFKSLLDIYLIHQ